MLTLNNPWLLAASYFLHLIATVVWIGGLATMALVVWPGIRRAVTDSAAFGRAIEAIDARFRPLSNISLAVLILTGFVQMNTSEYYKGLLSVTNVWAGAILLKHISIIGMITVGAVMNFSIQPALRRTALLAANGVATEAEESALRRRLDRLARINLILGILVLALTAVARAQ
jgi:uncharacterized membrane protein